MISSCASILTIDGYKSLQEVESGDELPNPFTGKLVEIVSVHRRAVNPCQVEQLQSVDIQPGANGENLPDKTLRLSQYQRAYFNDGKRLVSDYARDRLSVEISKNSKPLEYVVILTEYSTVALCNGIMVELEGHVGFATEQQLRRPAASMPQYEEVRSREMNPRAVRDKWFQSRIS